MRVVAPTIRPTPAPASTCDRPTAAEPQLVRRFEQAPRSEAALRHAWESQRVVPVAASEVASATRALIKLNLESGRYGKRMEGMQRIRGRGYDGSIEYHLAPNRKAPAGKTNHGSCSCALCNPPGGEQGFRFRDWVVWPNAYPYFPAENQHTVITAAKHRGQGFDAAIMADMLAYQRAASTEIPATLHYNGRVANSQFHLHWQSSNQPRSEAMPLQKKLDAGSLPLDVVRQEATGKVATFDDGAFYSGIYIEGDDAFISTWAARIHDRMETDPRIQGFQTLVLLHPKADGRGRLVMFPRRADNLAPKVPGFGEFKMGALHHAGLLVAAIDKLPPGVDGHAVVASRMTSVHPHELHWLPKVLAAPRDPRLSLRL